MNRIVDLEGCDVGWIKFNRKGFDFFTNDDILKKRLEDIRSNGVVVKLPIAKVVNHGGMVGLGVALETKSEFITAINWQLICDYLPEYYLMEDEGC